jgi:Xaa-Pro aminopeptidase
MLYLNGFPEPESALVITKLAGKYRKRTVMFVQPKERADEIWTGIRQGVEGATQRFLAKEAHPVAEFTQVCSGLLARAKNVYYRLNINPEFDEEFKSLWLVDEPGFQKTLMDPLEILRELRLRKTPEEMKMLRHAGAISAQAHCLAMQATKPGKNERQIKRVLEGACEELGATGLAYGSIVANGNNGVILHYTSNNDVCRDGDLLLVDAACEYEGYASDITRTWPVNGKFSEPQRELYEVVLAAQEASIQAVRPGVPFIAIHKASERALRAGLQKLGILAPTMTAKEERRLRKVAAKGKPMAEAGPPKPNMLSDFFMHGTSHWMGLDVHDPSRSMPVGKTAWKFAKRRVLEPGMCFTVEPGLYFDKDDQRVPEKYRGIAIRIEDDVIVTENGCEILTAGVPKAVADIERLMANK